MKVTGVRKMRFAVGAVVAILGGVLLAAAVRSYLASPLMPSEPMLVGLLGPHTYFRWVPAPWWQTAIWSAALLVAGLYLMASAKRRAR